MKHYLQLSTRMTTVSRVKKINSWTEPFAKYLHYINFQAEKVKKGGNVFDIEWAIEWAIQ